MKFFDPGSLLTSLRWCAAVVLAFTLASCELPGKLAVDRHDGQEPLVAEGRQGMVATTAPLASQVGAEILGEGGTAVDATVATAFVLAVVHPSAGNIGGGGFIVARIGDSLTVALDFREAAPASAGRNMFLDGTGKQVVSSTLGHRSAGVPGTVAGLWEFHQRFGTRPWAELLAPAIRMAREGFAIDERLQGSIRADSARFSLYPTSAALFLPGGRPPEVGLLWKNPDLASALERIAAEGPRGFYAGPTADLLVAEMKRGGGLITHDDLRAYRAIWRTPVLFRYRGHTIFSMPPPSSGGITLSMIGNILDGYDLTASGWNSVKTIHLLAEAMRRSYADRNHYLGDPDFVPIPESLLVSTAYAADRRSTIRPDRATPSREVGYGKTSRAVDPPHTTHFSIVDGHGNAVAMTTTLNLGYGSAVLVGGAGFLLNDEMDDFAAHPGTQNVFGLVQGEANAIAPGKRMLSSMSPAIVLDSAGRVLMVTGGAGGPRIISGVFQVISNVLDHHLPLDSAMISPRIHHQHLPDTLEVDKGAFAPAILEHLRAMGHAVKETPPGSSISTILRVNGVWLGMAEPAGKGKAVGY